MADHHRHGQPQLLDPVPEIVFAADRADLALASGRPCDPAEWIAAGGLAIGAQTSRRALEDATGGSPRMIEGDTGGGFVNSSRVRNPSEQAELSGSA